MSRKRLYSLVYDGDAPAYVEDVGNLLKLSGILLTGQGLNIVLVLPSSEAPEDVEIIEPTLEEWCEILRRADDPLVYQVDETGTVKAIVRKHQFAIAGAIQQKVWQRDGFRCMYCGKGMGDVMLTVDHFLPLELEGSQNMDNLLSACRADNKKKGKMHPKEYCEKHNLDYDGLTYYLESRAPAGFIAHLSLI